MNNKILVLFDFDGTITSKDSLIEFLKFYLGSFRYYVGLFFLSPVLISYKLKLISNHVAKEKLISHFFKGVDSDVFYDISNKYSTEEIDKIVRLKALEKINWHKEKGHEIIVVSASLKCWLLGWCKKNKLEILATEIEVKNNRLTGNFSTKNCYGIEKINRIKEKYNLKNYKLIYAYGDSEGDKEMLSLAHKKYYRPFR